MDCYYTPYMEFDNKQKHETFSRRFASGASGTTFR